MIWNQFKAIELNNNLFIFNKIERIMMILNLNEMLWFREISRDCAAR